ncbi:hypothetical protein M2139_001113 [Enterococcus sp. PF1-24]|uniref:hypothetical protein n=1 Tax=unclassified Enterococcus TaxID=2608891 RepID=UPI002476299B|nr:MULTISPECIES: hypothetical protein [unclassified Enterococcus]MDH6364128.1 hypothetical protein [Enterococcus sp. PFB1-1]MDH6401229.1 hypothetical protein [Enterococcus sp. PF1-24]
MKKVIFEQTGNIIIAVILILAACQTIVTSEFSPNSGNFELNFNLTWVLLISSIILFSLARLFYAKKIGVDDGYNKKDGEK